MLFIQQKMKCRPANSPHILSPALPLLIQEFLENMQKPGGWGNPFIKKHHVWTQQTEQTFFQIYFQYHAIPFFLYKLSRKTVFQDIITHLSIIEK